MALELLKNANIAAGMVLPGCQDTGTAIIMGKRGQVRLTLATVEGAPGISGVSHLRRHMYGFRPKVGLQEKMLCLTRGAIPWPRNVLVTFWFFPFRFAALRFVLILLISFFVSFRSVTFRFVSFRQTESSTCLPTERTRSTCPGGCTTRTPIPA